MPDCFIDFLHLHSFQAKTHFSSAVQKCQANWKTVHSVQERCLMAVKEKEIIVKDEKLKTRQKRRKEGRTLFNRKSQEEGTRCKRWQQIKENFVSTLKHFWFSQTLNWKQYRKKYKKAFSLYLVYLKMKAIQILIYTKSKKSKFKNSNI